MKIITRDDLHMRAVHQTQFDSFERGAEAAEKMCVRSSRSGK